MVQYSGAQLAVDALKKDHRTMNGNCLALFAAPRQCCDKAIVVSKITSMIRTSATGGCRKKVPISEAFILIGAN